MLWAESWQPGVLQATGLLFWELCGGGCGPPPGLALHSPGYCLGGLL